MDVNKVYDKVNELVSEIVDTMRKLEYAVFEAPYVEVDIEGRYGSKGYGLVANEGMFSIEIYMDGTINVIYQFIKELRLFINFDTGRLAILSEKLIISIKVDDITNFDTVTSYSRTGEYKEGEPLCLYDTFTKIVLRNGSVIYINAVLGKYYCVS